MKRKNRKWLTLALAGALCATTVGAVVSTGVASADTETTYKVTDIFGAGTSKAEIKAKKYEGDEKSKATFTFANGDYVYLKRDLAYKWFEGKNDAKYLNMSFGFDELNFKTVTLKFETESAVANEDGKATNSVRFKKTDSGLLAYVLEGKIVEYTAKEKEELDAKKTAGTLTEAETKRLNEIDEFIAKETAAASNGQTLSVANGQSIALALTEDPDYAEFGVSVNGTAIGTFTKVGANYGDYTYDKMYPLEIKAETEDGAKTVCFFNDLNGQQFDEIVDDKIYDTAAPVLVVNEDVNGFLLGTAFALDYEKVDVLQSASLSEEKKYYQFNPSDTKVDYDATLSTSVYFMDTVYYKDADNKAYAEKGEGRTATTVARENNGEEFLSAQITLGDKVFKSDSGEKAQKVYDLAWYANASAIRAQKVGEETKDFIVLNRNNEGAVYKTTSADVAQVQGYEDALAIAAKDVYAGSNSYIYLPSLEWLIGDNNGYRSLKFTISYKTESSTTAKTSSSISYNALKIATTEEGAYEFKVFAVDKAGNPMKMMLDGKEVNVTTSNVWDIDEIPSFSFEIANQGLKVSDPSSSTSRLVNKVLDESYTLTGLTVVGATNQQSEYALYRIDTSKYTGTTAISQNVLTGITYEKIKLNAESKLTDVGAGKTYKSYLDLYLDVYAGLVADAVKGDKTAVKACFTEVQAYNEKITEKDPEWETFNKYKWMPESKKFNTAEEGEYLMLANFWEKELPMQRAAGYKIVSVNSKTDEIEGESNWLKNNLVSVILFSIAGVMLILIIVLLLVKPSDETLEDVEKKAKAKKEAEDEKKE